MKNILFICHGNICRSPMAEYMFKKKIKDLGLSNKYYCESMATSNEEIGNDIYPYAKRMLDEMGIPYDRHYARRMKSTDYDKFDLIICMDTNNIYNLNRICSDTKNKVRLLLENRSVSDPWYTRDFLTCYNDIDYGLDMLIKELEG